MPGVTITLAAGGQKRAVVTDDNGGYRLSRVPAGTVTVTSAMQGFKTGEHTFAFDGQPRRLDFRMNLGSLAETVTVTSQAAGVQFDRNAPRADEVVQQAPSQNVVNMQRKVAGVLPVRVDVPRAGTSYRYVRPLVLDDETTVSLRYKRR